MQVHKRFRLFLAFAVGLIASDIARSETVLGRVTVSFAVAGEAHAVVIPSGFRLELLTEALQSPRLLTFAPDGDLFIGSKSGQVYRLRPPYREPEVFANPGGYPHAVAFRPGEILIAYTEGLYTAPYEPGRAPLRRGEQRLLAALPAGGGGHRSRTVRVGPDGQIYVSLGISGNCSNEYLGEAYAFQDRRGGVLVLDESGPKRTLAELCVRSAQPDRFRLASRHGRLVRQQQRSGPLGLRAPAGVLQPAHAGILPRDALVSVRR